MSPRAFSKLEPSACPVISSQRAELAGRSSRCLWTALQATMAGGERDITVLLSELGLQRYSATFEDEEFTDPALLLSMRHDLRQPSLEELGMCVHATG